MMVEVVVGRGQAVQDVDGKVVGGDERKMVTGKAGRRRGGVGKVVGQGQGGGQDVGGKVLVVMRKDDDGEGGTRERRGGGGKRGGCWQSRCRARAPLQRCRWCARCSCCAREGK